MSTKSVPNNQSLSWYQETLKNNCVSNGGEGHDYDREELVQTYYLKCNKVDSEHHAKRFKEIALEEDLKILDSLIPSTPIMLNEDNSELMYDEVENIFVIVPKVIMSEKK